MPGIFEGVAKQFRIDDAERTAEHMPSHLNEKIPFRRKANDGTAGHERLSPSVENLIGNDSDESPAHQGPTPPWAEQLLARDCINKFQEVAVEIGIAFFMWRIGRQGGTRQLPAQTVQGSQIFLKCWQRPEQFQSGLVGG